MALPEKPITRKEKLLSRIAGEETQIPEPPITREEQYLDYIARNGGGGGGGTSDYSQLTNKPQIDGVELSGNKTAAQLGLQTALTFDNNPTEDSENPVKSGGVHAAIGTVTDTQWSSIETILA